MKIIKKCLMSFVVVWCFAASLFAGQNAAPSSHFVFDDNLPHPLGVVVVDKQKDEKFKLSIGEMELVYFKNFLKATIARNLWDNDIYYSVLSAEDEFVQRAISGLSLLKEKDIN